MQGGDVGSLNIYMRKQNDTDKTMTLIWKLDGEQFSDWFSAQVPISSFDDYQVLL